MVIREIQPEDNKAVERIIREIFPEFKLPLTGTAYEDEETPKMFESYQGEKEVYYVLEVDGEVVGGAGIKPLNRGNDTICELQKMYFSPKVRGKGFGKLMFNKCLQSAKDMGYEKCYLESASELKTAINMYEKNGFEYLEEPLGDTGHFSCGVWMIKELL